MGIVALILVSSVIFWLSSKGIFKSALIKNFFSFKSESPTLFLTMEITDDDGFGLHLSKKKEIDAEKKKKKMTRQRKKRKCDALMCRQT